MDKTALDIIRPVALGFGIFGATAAIGAAQSPDPCAHLSTSAQAQLSVFDPAYNSVEAWQNAWDTGTYDRNHVMIGTVSKYAKSRLTLENSFGDKITIDLKEGTVIKPTGAKPTAGQRAAVFGYWSNGTFIANRIVLHG